MNKKLSPQGRLVDKTHKILDSLPTDRQIFKKIFNHKIKEE
jgi:hypothetical protein